MVSTGLFRPTKAIPLLFLLFSLYKTEKIDDSIHYYVSFTSDSVTIKDPPTLETGNTELSDDYVRIMSKNNERFLCKLPQIDVEVKKNVEYSGATAGKLLETMLYKDKMCSYLIDVYWTYQVCHGRYVIQYHEDKMLTGQVSRTEFYLGNFDSALTASTNEQVKPATRRIENEDYPYYSVSYNHGTSCDVTGGKPRTTDVVYICVEKVQHKILSVTEISSCHYEIVIMTDLLCKHPEYQLSEKKDHKIVCWNEDAKNENEAKPQTLQRLDDFHDSTFKREYTVFTDQDPQYSENTEEEDGGLIDEKDFEKLKETRQAGYILGGVKRFNTKESLANNPAVVHHTVNRILTGEDCIVGGTGWWKYEFCYGKHVIQFHEDANGQRSDILLGVFDEVVHKEWVKLDRHARGAIQGNNQIDQISQIYAKGDICDETGAHRDVEVRIRCATADHSALSFSMHLTEPRTCQYVLTIDSERFCEPLQFADDYGLIELTQVASSSQSAAAAAAAPVELSIDEEEEDEAHEQSDEDDHDVKIHEDL
ncbi:Endoplasmic reticulum lectin 1 [Caenorhabditis elegans]|uniref:Endoplasmic reticulum lectin 1 n=1 Tax=Caenorhabditis elegans TaxID=6239 RepID=Q9NF22_CAEEL|nr:MRH domain-containing protein [Caenorhabditis elegans]CAB60843.4 MRH domain-containing protein [Caenorhabditis elegans]|eukprot:NP_740930.3 Uncharacterized protein CELE_Y105E8A.2 [Caenorhabditis elegans]